MEALGFHFHKCPCGTIFSHPDIMAGNAEAHTCPSCRKLLPVPWFKTDSKGTRLAPAKRALLSGWKGPTKL